MALAAKSGQFIADETGKGQFFRGNQGKLAEEGIVRKISSSKRVARVPNLSNGWSQWAETWVEESVTPVLASESGSSFPESST